jgi:TctA family transporter
MHGTDAVDLITAAETALGALFEPSRMLILLCGVLIGIVIGIIPGLGGITALAILIPFTYGMDAHTAFAFLIGMWSAIPTSDVIPAVFFGVPGTVGCAATVLDGHPLARKGQAARALGACYTASTLGALFGAALLAISIPVFRPVILLIGSPELLAFCVFGISMVAALSGRFPLRGIAAAGLGLMIAFIGIDPQTGTERWTFGQIYLWDGMPIASFTLGLFAIPELAGLMIARSAVSGSVSTAGFSLSGQAEGFRDTLHYWWLTLRCSWLGAALGAVPGMGAAVIDWIAYGYAARAEKNTETFGTGDIRGVIASESANNAREGGALIPMISFGVPGSASTALLLGAFLIHGIVPGPEMLAKHLDVTFTIIWSLVIGSLVTAAICVVASSVLVKLVDLRHGILLPIILILVFIGAFQAGHKDWGDLVMILLAGVLGWLMKELDWPRPPLLLGVVLGDLFERYLFISIERYGSNWLLRPVVVVVLAGSIYGVARPIWRWFKRAGKTSRRWQVSLSPRSWFSLAMVLVTGAGLISTFAWPFSARIIPSIVCAIALLAALANLALEIFGGLLATDSSAGGHETVSFAESPSLQLDTVFRRGAAYFAWLVGLLATAYVIGLLPALLAFSIAFAFLEGRERLSVAVMLGVAVIGASWLVFALGLGSTWPRSILGDLLPALRRSSGGLI